jgi:hypothetical protein
MLAKDVEDVEYSLCFIPFDSIVPALFLLPITAKFDNDLDKLFPILPLAYLDDLGR